MVSMRSFSPNEPCNCCSDQPINRGHVSHELIELLANPHPGQCGSTCNNHNNNNIDINIFQNQRYRVFNAGTQNSTNER